MDEEMFSEQAGGFVRKSYLAEFTTRLEPA